MDKVIANRSHHLLSKAALCKGIITVLLLAWGFYQIMIHDMWRDELHSWLIASNSASFTDLISNARWEQHPLLWYISIWAVSFLSRDPIAVKVLHFCISASSILLILARAPFAFATRVLIACGYFFSFEYLIISRNYSLGVLLILVVISYYEKWLNRPVLLGVLLGMVCNTNLYGSIVSVALVVGILLDIILNREEPVRSVALVLSPYLILAAVCVVTVIPPSATIGTVASSLKYQGNIIDIGEKVLLSLLPVPEFTLNFWNTSLVGSLHKPVSYLLLLLTAVAVYASLRDSFISKYVFCTGLLGIIAFNWKVFPYAALRHNGMLFICFIVCVWMGRREWNTGKTSASPALKNVALISILVINVSATIVAEYYHTRYSFSSGRKVVDYIRKSPFSTMDYVGYPDTVATTIAGYLKKPFYYPGADGPEFYPKWGLRQKVSLQEALYFTQQCAEMNNSLFLFVSNAPIEPADATIKHLYSARGAIVKDENYHLYLIIPPNVDASLVKYLATLQTVTE